MISIGKRFICSKIRIQLPPLIITSRYLRDNSVRISRLTAERGVLYCVSVPSKSNAKNLDYILNAYSDEYKSIIDDHELLEAVKGWMEYKDQKKPTKQNHYDTEIGIKRFLKQVLNVYQKYGTYSTISVIDESMANNYMGVMWDRAGKLKGPHNSVFDEWRNA